MRDEERLLSPAISTSMASEDSLAEVSDLEAVAVLSGRTRFTTSGRGMLRRQDQLLSH